MKYILTIFTLSFFSSCSSPVEGLWIEANGDGYIKFSKDSVLNLFQDTLAYRLTEDSITLTGLDLGWYGKTENSFKYKLAGDTLQVWFDPKNSGVFLKTKAGNFHEYFLTKGNLKLELPSAENVRRSRRSINGPLNIRLGFRDEKIMLFVGDVEMDMDKLDQAIKKIVSRRDEFDRYGITCQLFIDENVTCDYTFRLFDCLRANSIYQVNFISKTDQANPYTPNFWGLWLFLPPQKNHILNADMSWRRID